MLEEDGGECSPVALIPAALAALVVLTFPCKPLVTHPEQVCVIGHCLRVCLWWLRLAAVEVGSATAPVHSCPGVCAAGP
jgi:hypothetical protein